MMLKTSLMAMAATAALGAGAAQAGVVFSDNFDGENGGASAADYTGFANWTVQTPVDLFKSGDGGVTCAGGSGSCVGLKGTSGFAAILTNQDFSFTAGQQVRLTFDMSGNQRDPSNSDSFGAFLFFPTASVVRNLSSGGAFGDQLILPGDFSVSEIVDGHTIDSADQPFEAYTLYFTAESAGSVQLGFSARATDDVGPVLDNVQLSIGAVPEPATWSLMIGGVGLAGVMLRRRHRWPVQAS